METLRPDDPRELGSYRLLGRLGAGGMGRVHLARSPGGRTVAVKAVRPEPAEDTAFRNRFQHEVDTARAVSGRYTAPVVDGVLSTADHDDGVWAVDARTGRARWGYNDNKDPGEPWQITISANRLPATHGYEVYALPAV